MKVALGTMLLGAMLNQQNVDVAAQNQDQQSDHQQNFHDGHDRHDNSWQPPEVCWNPRPSGQRYWQTPHCWNPSPICWHHDGENWQKGDGWQWNPQNKGYWQTNDDNMVGNHEVCFHPESLDIDTDEACWYAPRTCWNPRGRNHWNRQGDGHWQDSDGYDDNDHSNGNSGGYSNGGYSNQGGYGYPGR